MSIASHTAEEPAHTLAQYPAMDRVMARIIQLARVHVLVSHVVFAVNTSTTQLGSALGLAC